MGFRDDIKKENFQSTMPNEKESQSTDVNKIMNIDYDIDDVTFSLTQLVIAMEKNEVGRDEIIDKIKKNIDRLNNMKGIISELKPEEGTHNHIDNDNDELGAII